MMFQDHRTCCTAYFAMRCYEKISYYKLFLRPKQWPRSLMPFSSGTYMFDSVVIYSYTALYNSMSHHMFAFYLESLMLNCRAVWASKYPHKNKHAVDIMVTTKPDAERAAALKETVVLCILSNICSRHDFDHSQKRVSTSAAFLQQHFGWLLSDYHGLSSSMWLRLCGYDTDVTPSTRK